MNKNIAAEEHIKLKIHEDYSNGYTYITIPREDMLKAIEMARNERNNNVVGMQGWICPKCGRVYSPYTSMCPYCANEGTDMFKITCKSYINK